MQNEPPVAPCPITERRQAQRSKPKGGRPDLSGYRREFFENQIFAALKSPKDDGPGTHVLTCRLVFAITGERRTNHHERELLSSPRSNPLAVVRLQSRLQFGRNVRTRQVLPAASNMCIRERRQTDVRPKRRRSGSRASRLWARRVRIAVVNSGNSMRFVILQSVVPTNYETITSWDIQDDSVRR